MKALPGGTESRHSGNKIFGVKREGERERTKGWPRSAFHSLLPPEKVSWTRGRAGRPAASTEGRKDDKQWLCTLNLCAIPLDTSLQRKKSWQLACSVTVSPPITSTQHCCTRHTHTHLLLTSLPGTHYTHGPLIQSALTDSTNQIQNTWEKLLWF